MNLYILRHAIAVDRGTPGYRRDADRPLTRRGTDKMKRGAAGMRALGLSFDCVISSPLVRARHTAAIVVKELGIKKSFTFSRHLAPRGSPAALIEEIRSRGKSCSDVCLVGHEPYLSGLIGLLMGGNPVTLRKGGLCKLSVRTLKAGRCATLEWLLTPRQMRGIR
jgi:phosphohistidine phosphatase